MQILSIHLKNIKSHRSADFTFAPGINVLSGPNGAGKSTVFEALGYALFGVDARDFVTRADRFLTLGAKRGEVAVVFADGGGERWRVSRTVGSNSRWLLARAAGDDFETEEHANAGETETRLKELLGLSGGRSLSDQFRQIIGPFQHDFLGPFVIKSPTERQKAFDLTLGIDSWRQTYDGTSRLQSAIGHRIANLRTAIEGKREQLAVLPERQRELKDVLAVQAGKAAELTTQEAALAQSTEGLQRLERQKEDLDRAANALEQNRKSIASGREYLASQQLLVLQAETAAAKVMESRAGKEAFEQAEVRLAQLNRQVLQRRQLEQAVAELEKEVLKRSQAFEHEREEIDKIARQLAEEDAHLRTVRSSLNLGPEVLARAKGLERLKKDLDQAKSARNLVLGRRASLLEGRDKLDEGICPFFQEACQNIAGKEPKDVFTEKFDDFDREIHGLEQHIARLETDVAAAEGARQKIEALKVRNEELDKQALALARRQKDNRERAGRLGQLQSGVQDAERRAEERRKELAPFADLDAQIGRAEQERQRHQEARDLYSRNQQAAGELAGRRETLGRYQQRMKDLEQSLRDQEKELKALSEEYRAEEHQDARRNKDLLLAAVATLKQQIADLGKDRRRLETEVERLLAVRKEVGAKEEKVKRLADQEALVRFLRNQVFKNVSASLSERFREEISLRADRIYRTIAATDEELVWGENYQIVLRDMVDGEIRERSDDQLSGGQMMSAVVALRLALLQTIGARIAFFDEPTSNLDAARRENLAQAFRAIDIGREEVTEHWYDQLFLISHDVAFAEITDNLVDLSLRFGTE